MVNFIELSINFYCNEMRHVTAPETTYKLVLITTTGVKQWQLGYFPQVYSSQFRVFLQQPEIVWS